MLYMRITVVPVADFVFICVPVNVMHFKNICSPILL